MPTVDVDLSDLNRLLGDRYSPGDLRGPLQNLGIEVEDVSPEGLKLEVHHNRPDLFGVEGIARSLKGYLGIEAGPPEYDLEESGIKLKVDPSIGDIRPVAVMGIIRDAEFDDRSLKALMDLQEKLHEILGRDRQKISIGAYDLSGSEPPIIYTTTEPDGEGFVPLEFNEKLTPQEILEEHPKGQKYRHLIEDFDRYPLLVDSRGEVLSMPPIINSDPTRLTAAAEYVGVDVTGISEDIAKQALTIFMTAAAERGFNIQTVEVEYPERKIRTPEMKNVEKSFDVASANRKLGLDLGEEEASEIMRKMRYEVIEIENGEIRVRVPPYRFDLMHEVDLFEDLATGFGYDELEPVLPSIEIVGEPIRIEETSAIARRVLTGLGFMEVMPYILTSPDLNFELMRADGEAVTIENPVSEEYSILRTWLLPGLMDTLKENKRHELPQKVFEVGDVVLLDDEAETGAIDVRRAAGAMVGEEVDFTYARSVAEALFRELRMEWNVEPFRHPSFLEGRVARFTGEGGTLGFVGEIHPEVILNFDLEHPVAAFEIDLPQ